MKQVILVIVIIFFITGCSKKESLEDGFLNIPWGTTWLSATRALEEQGFIMGRFSERDDSIDFQFFSGKMFGYDSDLDFSFYNNKFYAASCFLEITNEKDFQILIRTLTRKYGKPSSEREDNIIWRSESVLMSMLSLYPEFNTINIMYINSDLSPTQKQE